MTSPAQVDRDAAADWYRCAVQPRNVAIVGASEDPQRSRYLTNLRAGGFAGEIYAVNPNRATVLGQPAYPSLRDLPGSVDLVIIQVAAALVPGVMSDAAETDAGCVYVGSAGFAEAGPAGLELQRQLQARAAQAGIRVIGPNGNGIMSARSSLLAAGFVLTDDMRHGVRDEGVAIVAQSGAVAACVLAMAQQAALPIGTYFATGNACDVSMAEVLEQLATDDAVKVVLLYLEGLPDGPRFLRAVDLARAAGKVIVALKVGTSAAGALASASHTATLAGDTVAYEGLFRQHGIVRAGSAVDLVNIGRLVRATGERVSRNVGVVSFSGGISVMLTDALTEHGFVLPAWAPPIAEEIRASLPAYASIRNPVDGTGALTASSETLQAVLGAAHSDPGTGITVLGLGILNEKEAVLAEAIARVGEGTSKPLAVVWLGGSGVAAAQLGPKGIPVFRDVPELARALGALADTGHEPPAADGAAAVADSHSPVPAQVRAIIDQARAAGTPVLGEAESKMVLAAAGISTVPEVAVHAVAEVRAALSTLSFPIVAKLAAAGLNHKSELNAVRLGLTTVTAVETTVSELLDLATTLGLAAPAVLLQEQVDGGSELLLGMKRDPTFGPLVVVGPGGVLAEAMEDVAVGAAPLTAAQAEALLLRLRHRQLITGFRGRPSMVTSAVTGAVCAFSQLAAALPDSILSLDVNPLIVRAAGPPVAVDALIELAVTGRTREEVAR